MKKNSKSVSKSLLVIFLVAMLVFSNTLIVMAEADDEGLLFETMTSGELQLDVSYSTGSGSWSSISNGSHLSLEAGKQYTIKCVLSTGANPAINGSISFGGQSADFTVNRNQTSNHEFSFIAVAGTNSLSVSAAGTRQNNPIGNSVAFSYTGVVPVIGVSIVEENQSLIVDNTLQLTAVVEPSNATNQAVNWSSSDETVATVSASGLVVGVAPGVAVITVTTVDGEFTDAITITVIEEIETPSIPTPSGVYLKNQHQGLYSLDIVEGIASEDIDVYRNTENGGLDHFVVWHFVLNQAIDADGAVNLTATFEIGGNEVVLTAEGRPTGKDKTQHFYIGTESHATIINAIANTTTGNLNLSHIAINEEEVTPTNTRVTFQKVIENSNGEDSDIEFDVWVSGDGVEDSVTISVNTSDSIDLEPGIYNIDEADTDDYEFVSFSVNGQLLEINEDGFYTLVVEENDDEITVIVTNRRPSNNGGNTGGNTGGNNDEEDDYTYIPPTNIPLAQVNTTTITAVEQITEAVEEEIFDLEEDEIPLAVAEVEVEEELEDIILDEEIPLAAANLPQTGELPAYLFYGIGALVSAVGLKTRKRK